MKRTDKQNTPANDRRFRNTQEAWRKRYDVPNGKSVCTCGHRGDGAESQHAGTVLRTANGNIAGEVDNGHGLCLIAGCPCTEFAWHHFVADA